MFRVVFVSVDAPQLDRLAADTENAVDKLSLPEAHPFPNSTSRHLEQQLVQIRCLGGPFTGVLDWDVEVD